MDSNRKQRARLLAVEEFAAELPASPETVRYWIKKREVESVRIGRRVFLPDGEIDRIRERGTRKAIR